MANWYIRDGASGANNGTSWTDAWEDLSDVGDWSSSGIARGDTVYVAYGIYNWDSQGSDLDIPVSGTTLITIKKATVVDHGTETGWNDSYATGGPGRFLYQFKISTSYWHIDGVTGGGPDSWESGHGFKFDSNENAGNYNYILLNGAVSNITVSHAEIGNSASPGPGCDRCMYSIGGASDVTVEYCYMHFTGDVGFTLYSTTDWVFQYNRIHQVNDSGTVPAACGGGTSHGAGLELGSATSNFTFRWNKMSDGIGSGWIGVYDVGGSGSVNGLYVYGNIFFCTSGWTETWGNGIFYTVSGMTGNTVQNVKIYNNTIVNLSYFTIMYWHADSGGNEFKNNIIYNTNGTPSYAGWASANFDYNASDDALAQDSNLQTLSSDPFENSSGEDWHLSANTDSGATLGSPYDVDMDGVTRSTWSRGAYEYTTGSTLSGAKLVMILT